MNKPNPREEREEYEKKNFSAYACKSAQTRGRKRETLKCEIRTEFQKDRDRIMHSKAFRRLMHKTQVFISPEGDHYRTRLTHTLEVSQIARTISRALGLNEDLTEAIALGHDLGHTPFGHTGEDAVAKLLPGGFRHNEQSARVVESLENGGAGLNLTFEVIDGIYNHRTSGNPSTLEGNVVRISDKIAYMNHDIDDALRSGLLKQERIPRGVVEALGVTSSQRVNFLVGDFIRYSEGKNEARLSPETWETLRELRAFLHARVYSSQLHLKERKKIQSMIGLLFGHYMNHFDEIPQELRESGDILRERAVSDYIAGMTDRFALKKFAEIFMPAEWGK
ncbi:MAG: deoxyguanosinetriphosphate triphosphohydrolase [Defluviitaleaceae bacterium]|nr:deoxyguanosinetriphosphate triphosphohydrolase [Defluviitaleaceae bacterium]